MKIAGKNSQRDNPSVSQLYCHIVMPAADCVGNLRRADEQYEQEWHVFGPSEEFFHL